MKNAIYTICDYLRKDSVSTGYFEVLKACLYIEDTYEIVVRCANEETKKAETQNQNIVYSICKRMARYSSDTEYIEVLKVEQTNINECLIVVKFVNTEAENKKVESDESNQ